MIRYALYAVLISVLAACAPVTSNRWYDSERGAEPTPFFERLIARKPQLGDVIAARKGDNYYRIATRHNVSLRALIEVNRARPPYLLNPGDQVRLPLPRTYVVQRDDTLYAISRRYGVDMSYLARANALPAPYRIDTGQQLKIPYAGGKRVASKRATTTRTASRTGQKTTRTTKSTRKARPQAARAPSRAGRFVRPLQGNVISSFGPKAGGLHNDGINIASPAGTPVKAAENGVVVYAGNELRGYGNLLLVRHSDGWVSAYAHTARFHVKQGQRVKQGQVIADVGQTGNVKRPQLHFELRKGTRAVNPNSLI